LGHTVIRWPRLGRLIAAVTGLPGDKAALQKQAAAIADLVRHFNLREGLVPQDDCLQPRLYRKMPDGDHAITAEELNSMLRDYYQLRGWSAQGWPQSDVLPRGSE
jgi:aldehyde:ferredoxin oxidoreductase